MGEMTEKDYRRALRAEPGLRHVERVVETLCELVRPSDQLCAGCVWERIIKPLATPLIGWGRGYPPKQAEEEEPDCPWRVVDGATWLRSTPEQIPATTETEQWLRTSLAWDAVTGVWLDKLDKFDPANGHGIGRGPKVRT